MALALIFTCYNEVKLFQAKLQHVHVRHTPFHAWTDVARALGAREEPRSIRAELQHRIPSGRAAGWQRCQS